MPASPTEKESRSRIRDNQRRSRARRKEHLQDLEQRVRQAELQGIQASVEIQAAARQVAEENKKLRRLLGHHGVSDRSVEAYLASGTILMPPGGGSRAGTPTNARNAGATVQKLEHILAPQKNLKPRSHTDPTATTPGGTAPDSHSSTATCQESTCTSPNPSVGTTGADENNCSMAADLISTMTGINPHEVRTSLGCTPGIDCHVDNNRIGDTIEQFTESATVT